MKKVSIIVPVYNVERYLRECLNSLVAQSYKNFEAILIDDGSTDTSGEICREYANKDGRFQVIHQANAGAANAKNAGLDCESGDYIAFVDSDDYVAANWLERMVTVLENSSADAAECGFEKIFTDHGESGNMFSGESVLFTGEEYMAQYLDVWTCSLFWNKLFKAELTKNIRFRRERRCIDDEFYTYKIVSGAAKVVRIADRLYYYRQRMSGAVASEKNKQQITKDAIEVLRERYEWVSQRFPDLQRNFLQHDVDMLLCFSTDLAFDEEAKRIYRTSARYYMMQCLRKFPGKVTFYYALRALFLPKRAFGSKVVERAVETEKYFP